MGVMADATSSAAAAADSAFSPFVVVESFFRCQRFSSTRNCIESYTIEGLTKWAGMYYFLSSVGNLNDCLDKM